MTSDSLRDDPDDSDEQQGNRVQTVSFGPCYDNDDSDGYRETSQPKKAQDTSFDVSWATGTCKFFSCFIIS